MKPIEHRLRISPPRRALVVLTLLAAGAVGCRPIEWPNMSGLMGGGRLKVEPVSSREVAVLSPDDIVRIMRAAGFSDEQIVDLGTAVRNAIQFSGAAQIRKTKVEATFAVRGDYVFITTRLRGTHIYDIKTGRFGVAPSANGQ